MSGASKVRYDVHPSVAMMVQWVATLPEKTGRSLDQWIAHIGKNGPKNEAAARAWLKEKHALGTNTCAWLTQRAFAKDLSMMDDDPAAYLALAPKYVAGQYAGKRAVLTPIFDRLYVMARALGTDVKVCPCKTMVPFYRENVFAMIKSATNTRVDLGLCLTPLMKAGKKVPARLIDTGGFAKKDRITHRIPLATVEDIDTAVADWLRRAYDLAAPESR